MSSALAALEYQFIILNHQIQIEKKLCGSLDMQVKRIRDSCLSIKENIKVKKALKISTCNEIKYLETNIQSSKNSKNITCGFENEMEKMMIQVKQDGPKQQHMERQRNFEVQWDVIKNTYTKLPDANDALQFQVLNKKMTLEIQLKIKEINDIKEITQKYRIIKENKTKAQIVKVLRTSMKNKESEKQSLQLREKSRSLNASNRKLEVTTSSLTGKQHKTLTPRHQFRKPNLIAGMCKPSTNDIKEKRFQAMNNYQKRSFSPSITPTVNILEQMIPPIMSVKCANSDYISPSSKPNWFTNIDENSNAPPKMRKKEDLPFSSPHINIAKAKDEASHSSKPEDIFIENEFPKPSSSKHIISSTNRGGNLSNDSRRDMIQRPERQLPHVRSYKYFPNVLQELPPQLQAAPYLEASRPKSGCQNTSVPSMNQKDCHAGSTFNFGTKGFQTNLENGNAEMKSTSKNVWDIFS